ncbi:hypothetical protein ACVWWP_006421 [Bradyrhizobium sp. LM3.6]
MRISLPRVWPVGARQYLHQGGFAGAVLAHQGVDFASVDGEVDVAQRLDAEERFGDPAHLEDGLAHHTSPARRRRHRNLTRVSFGPWRVAH